MDIQVEVSKNRSKAIGDLLVKAYEKGDKSIDDALSMFGVAPQQQTTQERENPALEAAPTAEPQQPEQASNILSGGLKRCKIKVLYLKHNKRSI